MKGDRFMQKSASYPASAGKLETCVRDGHAFADKRGRCVRCGSKIRDQWGDELTVTVTETPAGTFDIDRLAEPE